MRTPLAVALLLAVVACGGPAPTVATSSDARTTSSGARTSAPAFPALERELVGSYGMLVVGNRIEVISPVGAVVAFAPMAGPSLVQQACGQGAGAWVLPGVSATDHHIYFRDGDSKIRILVPPSSAMDVTTVPGGPHTISGFSISPDDQRIAVSVEDLSQAPVINLRLYVEDLQGGGHHADIYTTSTATGNPYMLWPMGWHQNNIVLAIWKACTFESVAYPAAWHVADAATAAGASIGAPDCTPGAWPSPAGVGCYSGPQWELRYYDWSGSVWSSRHSDAQATVVSPSGALTLWSNASPFNPNPESTLMKVDGTGPVIVPGADACLWIDEQHVLATDAVISYPSGAVARLPEPGECAGRFPGGL